jgi:hypothetical protein
MTFRIISQNILHMTRHIQNLTSFHSKLDQTIIYKWIPTLYILYKRNKSQITFSYNLGKIYCNGLGINFNKFHDLL